jgi:hypothetical protein
MSNSRIYCRLTHFALLIATLCLSAGPVAFGQEFKIESQVYIDSQATPIASSLTLFQDKLVFDITIGADGSSASEVVIFDSTTESFELLDIAKERRLHIEQFEIVRTVESMRQQGSQDERLLNLVEPRLVEHVETSTRFLRLSNAQLTYEASCDSPENATILPAYYQFLDQYTRLTATDPRRLPPFARLELNQAIKKHGWIPREIKLHLDGGQISERSVRLHSKHQLISQLSDQDKKRIELARRQWTLFKPVSLAEYREIPQVSETGDNQTKPKR